MAATPENQRATPLARPAHTLSFQDVIEGFGSNENSGLTPPEAQNRLDTYGTNDLGEAPSAQPADILLRQIMNALTLVRTFFVLEIKR